MPSQTERKIAYTPLSHSPTQLVARRDQIGVSEEELCCQESSHVSLQHANQDEDDADEEGQDDENMRIFVDPTAKSLLDPVRFSRSSKLELRRIRAILYLLALLLLIMFILQILGSSSRQQAHLRLASNSTNLNSSLLDQPQPNEQMPPRYDTYLSSILNERNQRGASIPAPPDDLLDPEPSPQGKRWWQIGSAKSGQYVTFSNYIRAMKSFNYNSSVTLTTQATIEFMYHTLELCKRWDGPISIAVFTPGAELTIAISLIKFLRTCLPAPLSACIQDKVTWHIAYNLAHGPPKESLDYPRHLLDAQNFPLFVQQDLCPKFAGPEPEDLIRQFELELRKKNDLFPKNYRQQFQLTYPINVLRNTARLAAKTKYLLASDIELYPSKNVVPSFINYMEKHNPVDEYNITSKKFIFTFPIFEVKSNLSAPRTKSELIDLVRKGDAIFFHKYVCDACQNFPNRLDWLQDDSDSDDTELKIFAITQRDRTRSFWEPIFIGTNEDPLYDDRLSWDGRRDKMGQMYKMCLEDYRLLILANAFLVHTPGIKHINQDDNMKRLEYIRENNAIYDKTINKLRQTYSNFSNIDLC